MVEQLAGCAVCWLVEQGQRLRADASRMAVTGESAGGNLAAALCLLARDREGPPIALQVLLNPALDLADDHLSAAENPHGPVLSIAALHDATERYLAGADPEEPYASPLRAKLEGLPPALVQTAQFDPLRDEGAAYADALRQAGVPVRHTNYRHATHGYASIPGVVLGSRSALRESVGAVAAALHGRTNFP
jgi:acetyl esterase